MKIAFIVSTFPCLSETFILNQITGLIDRGHKVDIFADSPGNDPIMHADVKKYNLFDHTFYFCSGTAYHTMPVNKFLRLIKAIYLIISNFHKSPVSLLKSLNVFKFGKWAASLSLFYKTITLLNKEKYDIVHCHFGPCGNLGVLLKDVGILEGKLITTFHGYDISSYIRNHGRNPYNYLFENGDLFLPISERWKDELIKLGCGEKKIVVHRMGVDTNKFNLYPRKPKNNGKVNLLTIARLVEKKGVQYGIQAVANVLKKYPKIKYKIIGDGPLKSNMKILIDELNINDNVIFLGRKRQEEIAQLMKDTDILLAPSVTTKDGDQEGIPVVLMEALAQGLPVVSTYHSGIPELVQNGKSGFLVQECDVNALTEKLIYLIEHSEGWPEMGYHGRKYVEEYHDINKLNDQLLDLYHRLLDGKLL